jgi:HSP20 family protein
MYIVKVRLARDIGGLYRRMNRMMDDMMNLNRPVLSRSGEGWNPEADIIETEEELRIHVNLAGVTKEHIEISYDETYLRIEGKRESGIPGGEGARYHQMEMGFGSFERVFSLPVPIDPKHIEASFLDGLLTIRMKKPDRNRTPRKII